MTAAELALPTPKEQQHKFLTTLFQDLGGFIDMRIISAGGDCVRHALSGIPAVEGLLANGVTDGRNVYIGPSTRISNSVAREAGGKKQLHTVRVIWADVDFKQKGDAEALEERLEGFPLPVSMRVATGGGQHLYWLLEEPFDLSLAANRARFEKILKGIADVLHADRSATDSSRVLRVPGTTNYPDAKKRAKGRTEAPAVLIECDGDHVFH